MDYYTFINSSRVEYSKLLPEFVNIARGCKAERNIYDERNNFKYLTS